MLADLPEDARPRAPELPEWLGFVWRCYDRLRHDRPWLPRGEGQLVPGRIAWRDVMVWADRQGLSDEQTEFLDWGVQVLDSAYLQWWEGDQKRQAESRKAWGR